MKTKNSSISFRGIKKIIFIIAIILILLIGGTYAWFTLTLRGSQPNVITAGTLKLTLDDTTTEGISIPNAYPVTDSEGMALNNVYTFKLSNDGSIASNYTIYLEDEATTGGKTRMDDSVVKFNLSKTEYNSEDVIKNGPNTTLQLLDTTIQNGKRVLDSGTLQPGEYIDYSFRIWMSYSAGNQYQNTSFNAKLKIEGVQVRQKNG